MRNIYVQAIWKNLYLMASISGDLIGNLISVILKRLDILPRQPSVTSLIIATYAILLSESEANTVTAARRN